MSIQFKRYSGSPDSGGAKLNIAYGDTAPEDTSKLWVKTAEPESVEISPELFGETILDPYSFSSGISGMNSSWQEGKYLYYFYSGSVKRINLETKVIETLYTGYSGDKGYVKNGRLYVVYSQKFGYYDLTDGSKTLHVIYDDYQNYSSSIQICGDYVCVFGGSYTYGSGVVVVGGKSYFNGLIRIYKISTGKYFTLNMAYGCTNPTVCAIGDKFYIFGGYQSRDKGSSYLAAIQKFDPEARTCTKVADLPIGTTSQGASVVGNVVYLFGGSETAEKVYKFDATTNTITDLGITLSPTRNSPHIAFYDSRFYIFPNTVSTLKLDVDLQKNKLHLVNNAVIKNKVKILNSSKAEAVIGITSAFIGDANSKAKEVTAYVHDGINWHDLNGEIILSKLYAPKISISGKTLTITNDGRNSDKVTNYKVYNGSTLLTTITATTLDLTTVITTNGAYNISVIATGTGYTDSDSSNVVEYNYASYSITTNLTNVTANASNPTTVSTVASSTLTFTASTGYNLPDNVTVTGAEFTWTKSSGTLVLSNPTGNVSITVAGVAISRTITATLTNVTAASGNATTIATGETKVLTYTANSGYNLPDTVSVTGATGTWSKANGTLTLSNPTGNVTFTIAGVAKSYTITPTLTNVTAASGNATSIAVGETKVLTYTAASGYTLPDTVTVTGATGVWNKDAGTLTLSNPTANVTFTIAGVKVAAAGYKLTVTQVGYTSGNANIVYADGTTAVVENEGTYNNVATVSNVYCDSLGDFSLKDSSGGSHDVPYNLTSDTTLEINAQPCIIEGTQITLANGTTKAIEDIDYDDELLVWNFYAGRFDTAKPKWIKIAEITPRYCLAKFSNGAEVGFVGPGEYTRQSDGGRGYHRIFNKEAGAFTYVGTEETPNGTTTFAQDGTFPTVVSQEVVKKEVKFYNVITDKHYNLFANGILTSCRLSNKYRIEDMKYVGEKLISDEQEKAYFNRIENKRK